MSYTSFHLSLTVRERKGRKEGGWERGREEEERKRGREGGRGGRKEGREGGMEKGKEGRRREGGRRAEGREEKHCIMSHLCELLNLVAFEDGHYFHL